MQSLKAGNENCWKCWRMKFKLNLKQILVQVWHYTCNHFDERNVQPLVVTEDNEITVTHSN